MLLRLLDPLTIMKSFQDNRSSQLIRQVNVDAWGEWACKLEGGLLELGRQQAVGRRQEAGRVANLRKDVDTQIGREGIRQLHLAVEGREHQVAHLDTGRRDAVAQGEVV